ncbi:hypothetical protein PF005_g7048 [Phytophthora fragariae]|uniref:Ubiquitin-like protease family profile domain-containing protein n=1 Tax=Phytophthora fragariae TaxID=53985 RepID=A0A6A3YM65_9STRA|nr:hypothetical protein PF005_g7048 [Phytophthora fragariae]
MAEAKRKLRQLGVPKGTLLGWKKALWSLLDDPAAVEAMDGENAYRRDQNAKENPEELTGNFNWAAHQFVLPPISGSDHYSFAVIENPLRPAETICYRIDSLRGFHDSNLIFAALKWLLAREYRRLNGECTSTEPRSFAYTTSPRQQNSSDCAGKMDALTSGSFNVTKAARSPTAVLEQLEKAKQEVHVVE